MIAKGTLINSTRLGKKATHSQKELLIRLSKDLSIWYEDLLKIASKRIGRELSKSLDGERGIRLDEARKLISVLKGYKMQGKLGEDVVRKELGG